jgi:hypothetical protein
MPKTDLNLTLSQRSPPRYTVIVQLSGDFKLKDMHEGNKTAETLCATGRGIKFVRPKMKNVNLEETQHILKRFPKLLWIFIVHRIWFYKNLALVSGHCFSVPCFGLHITAPENFPSLCI